MTKYPAFNTWILAVSLVQTFHQSVDASYYCGTSYNNAVASCNITCPSGLGYNPQNEENECPEDMPYCFGPDLPCTPSDGLEEAENATDIGFLNLADLLGGGDNETNTTSSPISAGNETLSPSIDMNTTSAPIGGGNETLAPSIMNSTSAPMDAGNETLSPSITLNGTFPPSIAPTLAEYNETNTTLDASSMDSDETNSTMALSDVNITMAPSIANDTLSPTPVPTLNELEFRKSFPNPSNMFCGR